MEGWWLRAETKHIILSSDRSDVHNFYNGTAPYHSPDSVIVLTIFQSSRPPHFFAIQWLVKLLSSLVLLDKMDPI